MATKAKETVETMEVDKSNWETVHVPKERRDDDENFIIVNVNFRGFKIMKGVDVKVPPEVAEVLRHSREAQDEADAFVSKVKDK